MKKFATLILLIVGCHVSFAQGMPVFDASNWLMSIEQLYQAYDQVMSTVKQIEQGYEQLQHYYNEARTWDFSNIQWDGDWDFRDEIRNATGSVNRQLSNIRKIEEVFTTKQFSFGGRFYTLKDIVGLGDPEKDIKDLFTNSYSWMKNDVIAGAINGFVNGLDESQKSALWSKYGLSPQNYFYLQKKKEIVNDALTSIMASATKEAEEMQTEATAQAVNAIISDAMDGEQTEKGLLQKQLLMAQVLIEKVNQFALAFDKSSALSAWQNELKEQEEKLHQEEAAAVLNLTTDKTPGALFNY